VASAGGALLKSHIPAQVIMRTALSIVSLLGYASCEMHVFAACGLFFQCPALTDTTANIASAAYEAAHDDSLRLQQHRYWFNRCNRKSVVKGNCLPDCVDLNITATKLQSGR